jgi:predicted dehydrogenase
VSGSRAASGPRAVSDPLAGSGPLRVVVLGAGANVWQFHRPALEAIGAEVVAVHDVDRAAAQRVADALGCAVAADLGDALRHDADLAVVMTSHVHHAELALACLRAGLHVLVEKPMAVTAGEADAMVAEAARGGRLLAVGVQQRMRAEAQTAKHLLHSGALGALQRFDVLATWPRRSSYFRTAPWRATWAGEGGGILINQGQHELDLLCWLAGPPAWVVARTSSAMHGREVEDTAVALLEWPGGATGTVRLSTAEHDERQRVEATLTGGRLRLTPKRLELRRDDIDFREYAAADGDPYDGPATGPVEVIAGAGGTHVELYRNLAGALAGEEALLAPGHEAAAAVELANAIVMSAQIRREVRLPLDRERYARLLRDLRQPAAATAVHRGGD